MTATDVGVMSENLTGVQDTIAAFCVASLTPGGTPPLPPQDALYPYEFMAFQEALKFAVQAVFHQDNRIGINLPGFENGLSQYQPGNADWLCHVARQVVRIVAGAGDQVVFQPDANAVDYACALSVIGTFAVAVTAHTLKHDPLEEAEEVIAGWRRAPVADILPGAAAVLGTARGLDDPDPAGTGGTYGETSHQASVSQLFGANGTAHGFAESLQLLDSTLNITWAGMFQGIPFLGIDASTRPELVAFADRITAQRPSTDFVCRFDAVCEPGVEAVTSTFLFPETGEKFSILIPQTNVDWYEYLRYAAQKGYLLLLFRLDHGATRPEDVAHEPGGLVVTFDQADLSKAVEQVRISKQPKPR